jgi:serine/threonine-protein kinase
VVGQVLVDRYEIIRFLNQGSCGKVYLARRVSTGEEVVVKVLHEQQAQDPVIRSAFRQEMEFMVRFRHPYSINLIESLPQSPFGPCIVMEYVKGPPLDHLLKQQRRFPPARVGRWLAQLCDALQHAHSLNIVHRDLKPSNLLVADVGTPMERIKIADFGLSQVDATRQPAQITPRVEGEQAPGTPAYLSPEQARGERVEARSDLYSVGVILFELLTGKRPFFCATPKDYEQAHAFRLPPTFAQLSVHDIPPAIEDVVRRCLAKNAADRPKNAQELVRLYEQALGAKVELDQTPGTAAVGAVALPPTPSKSGVLRKSDSGGMIYHMATSMPAKVAVLKLRGLLGLLGGECTEPEKGLLRARLPRLASASAGPRKSSLFAKLGVAGAGTEAGLVSLDVRVTAPDPSKPAQLAVTLMFQGPDGSRSPMDAETTAFCEKTCSSICASLGAKMVDA